MHPPAVAERVTEAGEEERGYARQPDVSELKKMRAAERKKAAMRQLKAAFERASTEGTLQKRSAQAVAS